VVLGDHAAEGAIELTQQPNLEALAGVIEELDVRRPFELKLISTGVKSPRSSSPLTVPSSKWNTSAGRYGKRVVRPRHLISPCAP
jgi:hypothetical protein